MSNNGVFKHYVSKFSQILDPPPLSVLASLDPTPLFTDVILDVILELLDDFYDMFQITKICFSIYIRNILGAQELYLRKLRYDSGRNSQTPNSTTTQVNLNPQPNITLLG